MKRERRILNWWEKKTVSQSYHFRQESDGSCATPGRMRFRPPYSEIMVHICTRKQYKYPCATEGSLAKGELETSCFEGVDFLIWLEADGVMHQRFRNMGAIALLKQLKGMSKSLCRVEGQEQRRR